MTISNRVNTVNTGASPQDVRHSTQGYPILDIWDQLDYVWGPDYVDELALVIHREGGVRYAIQDANYNLVAWLKAGSVVAAQYTYGPYGELRAADLRPTETEWPGMGVGHQGLFFIRFDGDPDDPPHAVGARGLYYNRNRWYSPELGRFITRDVNATALPILAAYAFNGLTAESLLGAFDGRELYGGGMNLYGYLDSNPANCLDAFGLSWDDDIDEAISGLMSDYIGALATVFQAKTNAHDGMMLALEYALAAFAWDELIWEINEAILIDLVAGPFFASVCFEAGTPVLMADGSLKPIEEIRVGERVRSKPNLSAPPEMAGVVPARDLAAADGCEEIDVANWRKIELHLQSAERGLIQFTLLRPLSWLNTLRAKVGREIPVSLPELNIVGLAEVVAVEPCPPIESGPVGSMPVLGTFATERTPVLALYIRGFDEAIGVTPSHTVYSADRVDWIPTSALIRGEEVLTETGTAIVAGTVFRGKWETVHNLEVHNSHTYYAAGARLLVHNACNHGRLVKGLRKQGFGAPKSTRGVGGKMYTHPNGTRVRIHPRPKRPPYPKEPLEKFMEAFYYRVAPANGSWGSPVPLPA